MDNLKITSLVVFIIGFLSLIFALAGALTTGNVKNHVFGLFLGIVLIGTAYINFKEIKKIDKKDNT